MAAPSAALEFRRPDVAWGRALANRRFRSLLLLIAAVPITAAYVWYAVVMPLVSGEQNDFVLVYLAGARMLAGGADPYLCNSGACAGYAHYPLFYPPLAFWLMQPLVGLDPRVVAVAVLIAVNLLVLAFVWILLRALEIRDWQLRLLAFLASVSFAPTMTEVQNRNLQIVVLALSAVVLLGWVRRREGWGGVALGIGLALKLIQAPLLLLAAWRRRFVFTAAAAGAWAVLWLVAAPQYLPGYLLNVLPSQAQGSGEEMNVAPLGMLARAFHPESLYKQTRGVDFAVMALAAGFAMAVVLLTAWQLGRPRLDADGRALEVAAAVAASPLLVTLAWAGQLVLLLLPMIVLVHYGLRIRSQATVVAVAASWFLIGPSYLAFTNAFAAGFGAPWLFELWSETALAGAVVLWLAALYALRLHSAAVVASRGR